MSTLMEPVNYPVNKLVSTVAEPAPNAPVAEVVVPVVPETHETLLQKAEHFLHIGEKNAEKDVHELISDVEKLLVKIKAKIKG